MLKKQFYSHIIVLISTLLSLAAQAMPANDTRALATPISTLPTLIEQTTVGAINEIDDAPSRCNQLAHNNVWFQYTPTTNEKISVSTLGSSFDTVVSVWAANAGQLLGEITCNDDVNSESSASQLFTELIAETQYLISVAGIAGQTGTLRLAVDRVHSLTNDSLDTAVMIDNLPFTYQQTTYEATHNDSENEQVGECVSTSGASVWFRYSATEDKYLLLDTTGSDFDTVVSIWVKDAHPLEQRGCGDTTNGLLQGQAVYQVKGGFSYYIKVAGAVGTGELFPAVGNAVLKVTELPTHTQPATALSLAQLPVDIIQNTTGMTDNPDSPKSQCGMNAGAGLWYQYTAENDQHVSFSTEFSNYDTVLSLWQKRAETWTEISCDDDGFSHDVQATTAQLTADLIAGETYAIQVSGAHAKTGQMRLRVFPEVRDIVLATETETPVINHGGSTSLSFNTTGATPVKYQWYQGGIGDKSQAVGQNSPQFITPVLTENTTYWLSARNRHGEVHSQVINVLVNEQANSIGLAPTGGNIATGAYFTGEVALKQATGEVLPQQIFAPTDMVLATMQIMVDANHIGQTADTILVASYAPQAASPILYMYDSVTQSWQIWSGTLDTLTLAQAAVVLPHIFPINIYEGLLPAGNYQAYTGYRLTTGEIFFNQAGLQFTVSAE